eukprot:jgi/Botrbrau1/8493/Bobra.0029s0001.1
MSMAVTMNQKFCCGPSVQQARRCPTFPSCVKASLCRRSIVRCNAALQENGTSVRQNIAAVGAACLLALAPATEALANEFDLLNEPKPGKSYVIDDASVLNKTTKKGLNNDLARLELQSGYRLEVATVRKLEVENDAFALGDRLIEKWYPTVEEGSNKGILLIVTTAKDGALTGGPGFMKALGDELIDSVVSANIPILTEEEKFNEATTSSVARISAVLLGEQDPGAPVRADNSRKRTYKTKEEVDKTRGVTTTIVVTLLGISFIVPMLQFYGYTSERE